MNGILLPIFVLASCLLQHVHATKYVVTNTVPNTPGGKMFDKELGVEFTLKIMPIINDKIFKFLEENTPGERKDVPVINVYITEFKGYAFNSGININISASALYDFYHPRIKSKWFFTSMMIHEMTHVFQWTGNWGCPMGLVEGMADYVMVKTNFYNKDSYTRPGAGKKWDEGYGVTERFLEYCDSLSEGFTAKLNKRMRDKYSDSYWVELLGKPVDLLWRDYKAKYGNNLQEEEEEYTLGAFPAGLEY